MPPSRRRRSASALLARIACLALLAAACTEPLLSQAASTPELPKPRLTAARRTHPIHLDGVLDEPDWSLAGVATTFTQRYPDPGKPATYQTEVRILYDDDAIYVGARMFDPHPDSIIAPMARRDPQDIYSDWFDVIFDGYHDRRTGFRFGVNPAGTKLDVYHFNDGDSDDAWDARWDVATRVDSLGWTAEYRIPLSQLRFHGSALEQIWGLNFYRAVARRDEWTFWSPYPPTAPGFISNFGDLGGLTGLKPASPIDIVPYVSTHTVTNRADADNPLTRGTNAAATVGADFRVGLGSALSLHGTINPDFGQVEVDPAVLNLSAVETFFPEKRPFFLEGAGIFEFGALPVDAAYGFSRFVHWRRIGRTPQLSPSAEFSDVPDQTTILGATKLSGRTSSGLSLGFVDAVTARENAPSIDDDGAHHDVGVEPLTNYFVGRVKKDLSDGRATIGVLGTATNRSMDADFDPYLRSDAYLYGVDASHASANRRWTLGGYWIGSRVDGSVAAIAATERSSVRYYGRPDADYIPFDSSRGTLTGHDASAGIVYQGTPMFGSVQLRETSPGFEINDLGYLSRSDARSLAAAIGATHDASASYLRSTRVTAYTINAWNFGGDAFYHELGFTSSAELRSLWNVSARAAILPSTLDDRLTRGGPLVIAPMRWTTSGSVQTDLRRKMIGSLSASLERGGVNGNEWAITPSLVFRPINKLQLTLAPTLDVLHDGAQYVSTIPDSSNVSTNENDYVFADLRQRTLSVSARADWSLTNTLSIQMFVQPFVSTARFSDYKALHAPRTFSFDEFGIDRGTVESLPDGRVSIDPDGGGGPQPSFVLGDNPNETSFVSRAIRVNGVIRWEYRSGSAIYLVWQQTRDGTAALDGASVSYGLDRVLSVPAKNVVYLKASYRFGR
jgi:Domain of unknown function (DUF5916)/Carbohydrate family 9 binding domain-like